MRWGSRPDRASAVSAPRRQSRDDATGLLTFAAFLHECGDALAAYVDAATPAEPALLLVELDGIHSATDADGHAATDEVMALVAARVAREVGSLGTLARVADQQIGVLFAHLPTPAAALDLAYRLITVISSPTALGNGRRVQLSASCGLVTREVVGAQATGSDLLRGARLAVLAARRAGRNRIEVGTAELVAEADETVAIGNDLRKALAENGLRVSYQPVVDLASGAILGFEALVRWSHPVHGHVSPARFVPLAEQFGLISELGRMVLSSATAQVQRWSQMFGIPLDAHVNIAGMDLAHESFVAMVGECLTASSLPATQLVLEISESAVEPELATFRSRFRALHDLGVRVALDDFGTGRSALTYLQSLNVDILKVDRSYLDSEAQEVGTGGDDLLRGVISLGKALGMAVYGEGIEDEDQRRRLRAAGCEIGQGYLFARPLPVDEVTALLRLRGAPADSLSRRLLAAESALGS